jgi:hypothetical protein
MPLTREQFLKLDSEGFTPEEIAGFEQRKQSEQPGIYGLPGLQRTEQQIKQRGSQFQGIQDIGNEVIQHPIKSLLNPLGPLSMGRQVPAMMNATMGTVEAPIANTGLAAQRGEYGRILPEALQGITGKRQGQIGDIARTTGFGRNASTEMKTPLGKIGIPGAGGNYNELIARVTGLGAMAAILPGAKEVPGKTISKVGEGLKNLPTPSKAISNIRDVGGNTRNAIKNNYWEKVAPKEYKAYGDAIENLPKSGTSKIDGAEAIKNLEEKLVERNLINSDGTLNKAIPESEKKFVKAYQDISKKWANSPDGMLNVKDIIDTYKNIKGDFKLKLNSKQRANISAANDFVDSISDQINNEGFSKAKLRYRQFKEEQKLIDKKIDLYEPDILSGKGEKFLTSGEIGESVENRTAAKLMEDKTGVNLKGLKALSGVKRANPLRYLGKLH